MKNILLTIYMILSNSSRTTVTWRERGVQASVYWTSEKIFKISFKEIKSSKIERSIEFDCTIFFFVREFDFVRLPNSIELNPCSIMFDCLRLLLLCRPIIYPVSRGCLIHLNARAGVWYGQLFMAYYQIAKIKFWAKKNVKIKCLVLPF